MDPLETDEAILSDVLDLLVQHEWCCDDNHKPYCDWCEQKTRAKNPGRKNHAPDCPWVNLTDRLRKRLSQW